jgi:hypothetical protein
MGAGDRLKQQLIEEIMKCANDETMKIDNLEKGYSRISQKMIEGQCPVSKLYNTHFNYVDLHDRLFYSVEYKHKIQNWHTKLALDVINVLIINAWTLYSQKHIIDFVPFRRALAEEILGL